MVRPSATARRRAASYRSCFGLPAMITPPGLPGLPLSASVPGASSQPPNDELPCWGPCLSATQP